MGFDNLCPWFEISIKYTTIFVLLLFYFTSIDAIGLKISMISSNIIWSLRIQLYQSLSNDLSKLSMYVNAAFFVDKDWYANIWASTMALKLADVQFNKFLDIFLFSSFLSYFL